MECYSKGMMLDPLSAALPANRALALLKLERLVLFLVANEMWHYVRAKFRNVTKNRIWARARMQLSSVFSIYQFLNLALSYTLLRCLYSHSLSSG